MKLTFEEFSSSFLLIRDFVSLTTLIDFSFSLSFILMEFDSMERSLDFIFKDKILN